MIMIIYQYHGIYQSPKVSPSDMITVAMQEIWSGDILCAGMRSVCVMLCAPVT